MSARHRIFSGKVEGTNNTIRSLRQRRAWHQAQRHRQREQGLMPDAANGPATTGGA